MRPATPERTSHVPRAEQSVRSPAFVSFHEPSALKIMSAKYVDSENSEKINGTTSLPDTPRTIENLYLRLFGQIGHSCALKIIELLVLEINEEFVRCGGLAGADEKNGLLFFGNGMQWTSRVLSSLAPGYCLQFAVKQIPTFEKLAASWGKLKVEKEEATGTTRSATVCHLLECSQFLARWDLSARANGTSGTLWGGEFHDPITGELNPTFPEQDGAEFEHTCDFWICCWDNCDTAEPFSIQTYRTGAWALANGILILVDNPEEHEGDEKELGPVEGFLVFHGPEISPPEEI